MLVGLELTRSVIPSPVCEVGKRTIKFTQGAELVGHLI